MSWAGAWLAPVFSRGHAHVAALPAGCLLAPINGAITTGIFNWRICCGVCACLACCTQHSLVCLALHRAWSNRAAIYVSQDQG